MSDIDQQTCVKYIENSVIQAKRCLIFGIAIISLLRGKDLDLDIKR